MSAPGEIGEAPITARLAGRNALWAQQRRLLLARLAAAAGLGAYNWWVIVLFMHGMIPSANGFFSDLSADGRPHALLLQRLDLTAGLLLLAALVLRRRPGASAEHRIWPWLVAFAAIAAIGGMYPYACAAGLDPACRHLERTWRHPVHHYVHMIAGVVEFFTATMAIALARVTDPDSESLAGRAGHVLVPMLLVAYPLLCLAYLKGRWGALVEPTFFLMFSAILAVEIFGLGVRSPEGSVNDGSTSRDLNRPAPG